MDQENFWIVAKTYVHSTNFNSRDLPPDPESVALADAREALRQVDPRANQFGYKQDRVETSTRFTVRTFIECEIAEVLRVDPETGAIYWCARGNTSPS